MEILVTNDDSYTAKGIKTVAELLSKYGNVTVVAPSTPQSGKSASLSLTEPIRCKELYSIKSHYGTNITFHSLTGSPADCIKWAANYIYSEKKPDLIVSGINHGANTSAASVYSGTLGAAAEGTIYGVPSIGISINTHNPDPDFSAIEKYFPDLLENFIKEPIPDGIYLNINFPDLPAEKIKGIKMAAQGKGRWIKEFTARKDPRGEDYYWMTGNFENLDTTEIGDHKLVEQGYATIVPHKVDSTEYTLLETLTEKWNLNKF